MSVRDMNTAGIGGKLHLNVKDSISIGKSGVKISLRIKM